MATKDKVLSILQDAHKLVGGHIREKETYLKISEFYDNVSRSIISEFIKQREWCVEKSLKKK